MKKKIELILGGAVAVLLLHGWFASPVSMICAFFFMAAVFLLGAWAVAAFIKGSPSGISRFQSAAIVLACVLLMFFGNRLSWLARACSFNLDYPAFERAYAILLQDSNLPGVYTAVPLESGFPGRTKYVRARRTPDGFVDAAFVIDMGLPMKKAGFLRLGGSGERVEVQRKELRTSPMKQSGWFYFVE